MEHRLSVLKMRTNEMERNKVKCLLSQQKLMSEQNLIHSALYHDIEYSFLCYTVVSCTEEINTTLWLHSIGEAVRRYPTPKGKGEAPARR